MKPLRENLQIIFDHLLSLDGRFCSPDELAKLVNRSKGHVTDGLMKDLRASVKGEYVVIHMYRKGYKMLKIEPVKCPHCGGIVE